MLSSLKIGEPDSIVRVFKTAWFVKAARKAGIPDIELCDAVDEIIRGQADNLGGGVFKKRLNRNRHRSIVLAKSGQQWIYVYLFAKKDRANIETDELEGFRKLAKVYADIGGQQLSALVANKDLTEICQSGESQ